MKSSASCVVLGAGLMGRLLAWQLARRGHRVEVHEASDVDAQGDAAQTARNDLSQTARGAAARVAAAMLAPLAESAITEPSVVEMGRYALGRWPQLLAELSQPVFFQQAGTLILWHRQDTAEARRFADLLRATGDKIPMLPRPQALDAAGVRALEPTLEHRFAQGLYLPEEGQLDNRQLLTALLHELQALGVELRWNSPRAPEDFQNPADRVFDCRGLGAQPQMPTLRGVRGEVARVHAPGVGLTRPTRLIHPRYPIYIAPKQGDLYVIGATEIESQDMSPPSVRSTLELLSAAYAVHPAFGEGRIIELATQCRPALPDNLPAIRLMERRSGPRTMQINGLYRHGFMIAPALLDAVLELVEQDHSPLAQTLALEITP